MTIKLKYFKERLWPMTTCVQAVGGTNRNRNVINARIMYERNVHSCASRRMIIRNLCSPKLGINGRREKDNVLRMTAPLNPHVIKSRIFSKDERIQK